MPPVIAFAGMTHLGLVSGVCAAEKGFRVVCFEPDGARISAIARGELPVSEPRLDDLVKKNAKQLKFTSAAADLAACDVVYVAPDVPTDDLGQSDLGTVNALLDRVFAATREDAVIVVLSQVPPGFTRGRMRPGRFLYYQVETLVFGRAVERALKPERYVVGCEDPLKPLPHAYAAFLGTHGCPILPMRYESAELAKIAINCCLVASVTTANTLAELSERIGADWGEIVPALRLDQRIGQHAYLAPGLGLAGGNLERDLATVLRLAGETGTDAGLIHSMVNNSQRRRDWALRTLHHEVLSRVADPLIAMLGLAYKENTHSTRNSPSLALIRHLKPWRLRVYDPVVTAQAADHPRAAGCASPLEATAQADALVIMTPWPEFRGLKPEELARAMRGRVIIDPYRVIHARAAVAAGFDYFTLGMPALRAAARKATHA
jgi:UDPglucose 6-dehydrogenase